MATIEKQDGVDGDVSSYSVPHEAEKVFHEGIFSNDLITQDLPKEVKETTRKVQFTGTDLPSIPNQLALRRIRSGTQSPRSRRNRSSTEEEIWSRRSHHRD
jgi:hypothetical protein